MPAFLSKNKNQLNTQQANSSRIVTKLRWVVEAINTFLKNSFKALRQVQNKSLPHTHEDYRIAGALINKYFRRLFSDKSNDKQVIKNMKDKLHVDNELQKIVQNELNSKTKFDKLDCSDISDFLKLEVDEIIKDITLGEFSLSY
jgi:hypothetical protein